jgi:hypothetical protein
MKYVLESSASATSKKKKSRAHSAKTPTIPNDAANTNDMKLEPVVILEEKPLGQSVKRRKIETEAESSAMQNKLTVAEDALNLVVANKTYQLFDFTPPPPAAHSATITSNVHLPARQSSSVTSPFVGTPSAFITTQPPISSKPVIGSSKIEVLNKLIHDVSSVQHQRIELENVKLELERQKSAIDLKMLNLNAQLCGILFQTIDTLIALAGN